VVVRKKNFIWQKMSSYTQAAFGRKCQATRKPLPLRGSVQKGYLFFRQRRMPLSGAGEL
jgi:hypothetical protein